MAFCVFDFCCFKSPRVRLQQKVRESCSLGIEQLDIKTNGQSFSLVTLIPLTFGQIPGYSICPWERPPSHKMEQESPGKKFALACPQLAVPDFSGKSKGRKAFFANSQHKSPFDLANTFLPGEFLSKNARLQHIAFYSPVFPSKQSSAVVLC